MWISELSERTGFPVDTIKHYLRVGVLPRGTPVGPQRAEYDDGHVDRLKLVRALHEVGRLTLDQIRRIFDSVDTPGGSLRGTVGEAHLLLSADLAEYREPTEGALRVVDAMIERHRWHVHPESTHRRALAVAIDTLVTVRGEGYQESPRLQSLLNLYASHATEVARDELQQVDMATKETTLNSVVVGSVLFEPLVLLMRRLAQEHASRDWWAEERWKELADEPEEEPAEDPDDPA